MRPLSPSPSETRRLPSPLQAGSGPAPFRLPRGPPSQPVCPSPAPFSSFLIPPSVFPLPCFLLLFPHRISYLPQRIPCSPSLHPPSCYLCTLPPVFLNPSLHPIFSSLDFHFPSVFPFPLIFPIHHPTSPVSRFSPPSLPLVSASQSVQPTTLCPPDCLHPTPGHPTPRCSGAVRIAHLPGCRFEGAGTTV